MKICAAQTRPVKGDIQSNIDNHKKLIDLAASNGADTIIFPELSITGYEPELAKDLATDVDDGRFDDFQKISDAKRITVGIGVPLKEETGISISMVIFQPQLARQKYSKKYLHSDEEPFFVSGQSSTCLIDNQIDIALAICYELSVPEHAENAVKYGAKIYVASVAKTEDGVRKAIERLSDIASKNSMPVLMSNCVGRCDNFESAGKSSVWNDKGLLIGQLDNTNEGIIFFDTDTQRAFDKTIENERNPRSEETDYD